MLAAQTIGFASGAMPGGNSGRQADNSASSLKAMAERFGLPSLWHITSCYNMQSLVQGGILNRNRLQRSGTPLVDISAAGVQNRRQAKGPLNGLSLHDYVPLYMRPRNPMLYCRREFNPSLCLLEISTDIWLSDGVFFTDGNAASQGTRFFNRPSDLDQLDWTALDAAYWHKIPDGKRKRCAEVLVPYQVPASFIQRVHTAHPHTCLWLQQQGIAAVYSPERFFRE